MTKDKDYSKGTFGKHKFTVPREAHYLIRYADGTTETKLLKLGATYEFPTANSIQEIQPVAEQELPNMMCGADRYECQTIEEMNRHMETEHHVERNDLVATYQRPTLEQLESANPTPKEKSISEILDTAFNSVHTNGSHADDPSDKRPCYCHNRQYAEQALTAREASIRKDEIAPIHQIVQKPKNYDDMDTAQQQVWVIMALGQIGSYLDDRIKQIERG